MKYLLVCPSCGTKLPVETGQAGQMQRCACGHNLEVPTVRGMRELEEVADAQSAADGWTTRHGLVFVGSVIAVGSLILAAYVWLMRPAEMNANLLEAEVDESPIGREVAGLSLTETFIRFQLFNFPPLPPIAEQLKQGSVPVQLLP